MDRVSSTPNILGCPISPISPITNTLPDDWPRKAIDLLVPQIIAKKRDQHELSPVEIQFLVEGLASGEIPDYQIAAWAMAVLCRGMTDNETAALTSCMLDSGHRLQRSSDRPRVDKHSTGGLGDKVSLVLAPLLACFDVEVPMLSGRGLGITGGTLDKLESYSGYRCDLTDEEIAKQLAELGCVITGTTKNIAPADRKLYALRDVTGTVPSVPLITSSILSKKLAEALDALVLDVKVGSGSFMKTQSEARELANCLTSTSQKLGLRASAVITDMNQPLGQAVGNACEANEAVEVLKGGGPIDLRELSFILTAKLLVSVEATPTLDHALSKINERINSGAAFERYVNMIEAQGGTFSEQLNLATENVVTAQSAGWVAAVDGEKLGNAIIDMGGGRREQSAPIDHSVGLCLLKKIGDPISTNEPLVRIHCHGSADKFRSHVQAAITIQEEPIEPLPLIVDDLGDSDGLAS